MTTPATFDSTYATQQLRRAAHPMRQVIKRFYIDNILREVTGSTIDFGCGAGQLLRRLPSGSVGLEVNPYLVTKLRETGLDVLQYDPDLDRFALSELAPNKFRCLVIAHVLEHIPDAASTLHTLCRSCKRLGVEKIIVVVPGASGFKTDATHRTFVDREYLRKGDLFSCEGYAIAKASYFPINIRVLGDYFAYHEFKFVYERLN